MEFPALRGRSILVVEDELLIGMDIRSALEDAGAHVTSTTTVRHALILAEHDLQGDVLEPSDLHVLLQRVVDVDPDNQILLHRMRFALSRIMREFGRRCPSRNPPCGPQISAVMINRSGFVILAN